MEKVRCGCIDFTRIGRLFSSSSILVLISSVGFYIQYLAPTMFLLDFTRNRLAHWTEKKKSRVLVVLYNDETSWWLKLLNIFIYVILFFLVSECCCFRTTPSLNPPAFQSPNTLTAHSQIRLQEKIMSILFLIFALRFKQEALCYQIPKNCTITLLQRSEGRTKSE